MPASKATPFPKGGTKYAIRCYCTKCKKGYIVEPVTVIPPFKDGDLPDCYYSSIIDFCKFCGAGMATLKRDCDQPQPKPKKKCER